MGNLRQGELCRTSALAFGGATVPSASALG